jgi:hypothetical protein
MSCFLTAFRFWTVDSFRADGRFGVRERVGKQGEHERTSQQDQQPEYGLRIHVTQGNYRFLVFLPSPFFFFKVMDICQLINPCGTVSEETACILVGVAGGGGGVVDSREGEGRRGVEVTLFNVMGGSYRLP